MRHLWSRLRGFGDRAHRELDAEIRHHLDHLAADHERKGLTPAAARLAARRDFGSVAGVGDQYQAQRRLGWMADVGQDTRLALRSLRRSPRFTALAVLTLALGIGATTAIFSVLHAVLLQPLPYADADRLVMVWETLRGPRGSASVGHFHDWTEQNRVLERTAAMQRATYNLTDDGTPERVTATRVTGGFFDVAYVPPVLGRYISEQDVSSGSRVAVLSHRLWRTRYLSDAGIVGRDIWLGDELYTVVGVAPAEYTLLATDRGGLASELGPQLWTPLVFSPDQRVNFGNHAFRVIARLTPGVTRAAAQTDLERVTRGIAERHPENMAGRGVHVEPLGEVLVGNFRTQLTILLVAVGLVTLSGCVNVAGLLLVRAGARRTEIATRTALGAGRGRLTRQLLTESLVLGCAGGLSALLVARLGVAFLVRIIPPNVPRLSGAGISGDVLLFAGLTTLGCAVLFGVWPARRASTADVRAAVHGAGHSRADGRGDRIGPLVAAEIAIAVVLLVAAGLFVRSAMLIDRVSTGYRADGLLAARIALPLERYGDSDAITAAYGRMLEELRAASGIVQAGVSSNLPLGGNSIDAGLAVDGRPPAPGEPPPSAHVRLVSDDYLDALAVPLVRGRLLEPGDMRPGAPPVVVVNERLASLLWAADEPLGQRVSGWTAGPEPEWREVVGVVADVRTFGPDESVEPEIFVPYTQAPSRSWDAFERSLAIVIRVSGDTDAYAGVLRQAVRTVDPTLPLFDVQTLDEMLAASTAPERFRMRLFGAIAAVAILLAAVGVYGVVAYAVTRRTREIGIRMALGAGRIEVMGMVVRQALVMTLVGIAVGLAGAAWVTRYLEALLFDVTPLDAVTFVGVAVVFTLVAAVAAYLPAHRAARVDPLVALRYD